MSDGVVVGGELRCFVDVFLELEPVQDLLLDAQVLATDADGDGVPLVRLGRIVVALHGFGTNVNRLKNRGNF